MGSGICKRGSAGVLAAALAASVALALPVPAGATVQAGTDVVCPEELVPTSGAAAGAHTPSVDCLARWGANIYPVGAFDPGAAATRAELAAILDGLLARTDRAEVEDSVAFDDMARHRYAEQLGRLAALGVITGFADGTFGPERTVQRDQMASMLMRLVVEVFDVDIDPAARFSFGDVTGTSVHRANIALIVAAGITTGVSAGAYDPAGQVTRGQAATFAVRVLDVLAREGHVRVTADDLGLEPPIQPVDDPADLRGVDLATDDDPGANATADDLQVRGERIYWGGFDYARHRLCADVFRYDTIPFGVSSRWMLLEFDEQHEATTGLASCIWTYPDARYADRRIEV